MDSPLPTVVASGRPNPEATRLCSDLRRALAQEDQRRQLAKERLRQFEADAELEELELQHELQSARDSVRSLQVQRQAISQDRKTKKVLSEIREVGSERDAMLRAAAAMQDELSQSRVQLAQVGTALVPDPTATADAAATDAIERSLRAEVASLRSALQFCERRSEDGARTQSREVEAVRRRREEQHEEKLEIEAAEDRLRLGRACVADALSIRRPPHTAGEGLSPRVLRDAALQVESREQACQDAQAELEVLHEECGQLLRLNAAAEARVEEFEQRLAFGGLRATIERALALLQRLDVEAARPGATREKLIGAARLVLVLAQVCGMPRMAYLALDSNRSGRVSMCEFDSGLRLRFGLDYEAITKLEKKPALRPLFKEFDIRRKGFLSEEDFARTCPEIWQEFGRGGGQRGLQWPAALDGPPDQRPPGF